MKSVTIRVREVGQKFACCADVVAGNNRVIFTTRDYPYGYDANARARAEQECDARGLVVRDGEVAS